MTQTNIESRLRLAVESHKHLLPEFLVKSVLLDIDHDELGLALEIFVEALIEGKHPISETGRNMLNILVTELSEFPREHLRALEEYCPDAF